MVRRTWLCQFALVMILVMAADAMAQQAGSVRGTVYDKEFDVPVGLAQVTIAETGQKVATQEQGNFVFPQIAPGTYTLIFTKDGYNRLVKSGIVVSPGQLVDLDVTLAGDIAEMEELVVQDLKITGGSEVGLLTLRLESPQLLDSIGSELIGKSGASDAAGALKLVSGATVSEGKYAVVRGLPDRYVNSQLNGVRLPTADINKRAVELDQFPATVIESIQVSKTFTPDQQGDASGGAVNLVLKSIPEKNILEFSAQTSYNTQTTGNKNFLTYKGGGVNYWGMDDGRRDIQSEFFAPNGGDGKYNGAVGVSRDEAPIDYKWSGTAGGKQDLGDGVNVGGLLNIFNERASTFYDNGRKDSLFARTVAAGGQGPGGPLDPQFNQAQGADPFNPDPFSKGEFKTSLFDQTRGIQEAKWGGLGSMGLESKNHSLKFSYLYTQSTRDIASLNEDIRGKSTFYPGFDPNNLSDPNSLGGIVNPLSAPNLRFETLDYTERTTSSLQFSGTHALTYQDWGVKDWMVFHPLKFDWTYAQSSATLNEPDKRQFGSLFIPQVVDTSTDTVLRDPIQSPAKTAANFTIGNLQRVWKDITEESDQYSLNLKLPFTQWTDSEGYFKIGLFNDAVVRKYNQDSFSNFNDSGGDFIGDFSDFWSSHFPSEVHNITPADIDVDYRGDQNIKAVYWMADIPLTSYLNVIGGIRYEDTNLKITNSPEKDVTWVPPGSPVAVQLNPGDADVSFRQEDVLPAIGLQIKPVKPVTIRLNYAETVARQTFKELTPIQQTEYLGADVFIGNPELKMSALKNYDVRIDYTPFLGSLISFSWFYKDVKGPIEYVQRDAGFPFTFPVNYPKGKLSGYEVELRQKLGTFWEELEGLSIGGNATIIDSEVTVPEEELQIIPEGFRENKRDMTNAPAYLYNAYLTYELARTGTELSVFYTVRGDTLIAGAGTASSGFVPSVYEAEFGTLNLSLSQKIGKYFQLKFQAKNLTNPEIREVYRSQFIDHDTTRSSYTKGIDLSISISAQIPF